MSLPAATITGLRRVRPGKVAIEVDGDQWRLVSDDVILRLGLKTGESLDRPMLRRLRTQLRSEEAVLTATRALERRDLSRSALADRLARAGIAPSHQREALSTLERSGLIDDRRVACTRMRRLADKGWGDAAIQALLVNEGIPEETAREALLTVEPENERIGRFVRVKGDKQRAATHLARRGFQPESIEAALGLVDEAPLDRATIRVGNAKQVACIWNGFRRIGITIKIGSRRK